MRTDIVDLYRFYTTPLGRLVATHVSALLAEAWGEAAGSRIAGFGYAAPFLDRFTKAERRLLIEPSAQGALAWPSPAANLACLAPETQWPLPDASIDLLLIVHGFEEASEPQRLIREAWRVLTNSGRMIIVVTHRRGLWSALDTTPFSAGRPYSRRQMQALLEGSAAGQN